MSEVSWCLDGDLNMKKVVKEKIKNFVNDVVIIKFRDFIEEME